MYAAAGVPTAPEPEIVALNRMGFGPRPGDLAALMALGATTDERLTTYVDQQLNPAAIDDSECDARHRRPELSRRWPSRLSSCGRTM